MKIDLKEVVHIAIQGMSGDNAQPWFFRYRDQTLEVHHDEIKARHYFNRNNHASIVSVGTVVELIVNEAARQGFRAELTLTPNFGSSTQSHWVNIVFVIDGTIAPRFDSRVVFLRRVHRGFYDGGSMTDPIFTKIAKDLSDLPLVKLHIQNQYSEDFINFFTACEQSTWAHGKAIVDLLDWVRFTEAESIACGDGMYWKELGVKIYDLPPFWLIKKFPGLLPLMFPIGIKQKIASMGVQAIKSSAGIMCFSSTEVSLQAAFQTGRAAMRSALYLATERYAVQPLSSVSLNIFDQVSGHLPADFKEPYRTILQDGRAVMAKTFGLAPNEVPIWAFRVGLCPHLENIPKSLRRPTEGFLKDSAK